MKILESQFIEIRLKIALPWVFEGEAQALPESEFQGWQDGQRLFLGRLCLLMLIVLRPNVDFVPGIDSSARLSTIFIKRLYLIN